MGFYCLHRLLKFELVLWRFCIRVHSDWGVAFGLGGYIVFSLSDGWNILELLAMDANWNVWFLWALHCCSSINCLSYFLDYSFVDQLDFRYFELVFVNSSQGFAHLMWGDHKVIVQPNEHCTMSEEGGLSVDGQIKQQRFWSIWHIEDLYPVAFQIR